MSDFELTKISRQINEIYEHLGINNSRKKVKKPDNEDPKPCESKLAKRIEYTQKIIDKKVVS